MPRRRSTLALFFSLALAGIGACDAPEKTTPRAIFQGQLSATDDNKCQDPGPLFEVGTFGNPSLDPPLDAATVEDGATWHDAKASVSCAVTVAGNNEFSVIGTIAVPGDRGGFFHVDGHFTNTGDQKKIHAVFSSHNPQQYEERDYECTVRFTTPYQGIVPGRVWGDLDCPMVTTADSNSSCTAVAQFRFENCAQ